MRKQVILTVVEGNFEQGFSVIIRIWQYGALHETQLSGRLPPAPNLLQIFNSFRSVYNQWQSNYRIKLVPIPGQVTNFSDREVASSGFELANCLNEWLNSDYQEWKKIREELLGDLSEDDEIEFIIQTQDIQLRQLPWHLWDLISERFVNTEFILSSLKYKPPLALVRNHKVRILAILGDTTNIQLEEDKAILQEQLPDAEIDFLVQPNRQLLNERLWEQQWDILFFAGHSISQADGSTGEIFINQDDSLSLKEISNALRRAAHKGLQLAIFNSCDGLGLAQELADLNIPIIVMRMPVPDVVAQKFLQHFLRAFASGNPLHLAVREARERLQGLENEFPCASWLAALCQNPTKKEPLTWQSMKNYPAIEEPLTKEENNNYPHKPRIPRLRLLPKVIPGVLATALAIIVQQIIPSISSSSSPQKRPLDQSTFQGSCIDISINKNILSANCYKIDETLKKTSIPVPGIRNVNGDLVNTDLTKVSTFQDSCKNISIKKDILSASCYKLDKTWKRTSIYVLGIRNNNGNLENRGLRNASN